MYQAKFPALLIRHFILLASIMLSNIVKAQSTDPVTNDCNNYFDDGKPGTYTAEVRRKGDAIYGLYDHYTKEPVTYTRATKKPDGTLITDEDLDGVMIRKKGDFYYLRNIPYEINIKWFGAKGDGTAYENVPITKCFKYVTMAGGGTISFPAGVYNINADIKTYGENELVFSIPASTTIKAYNATFSSVGNFCFRTASDNIRWYGGKIIRGRMEIKSSNVKIQNLRIEYSWNHSFHLSGGKSTDPAVYNKTYQNVELINCTSYRSTRHGFAIHRGAYSFTKGVDTFYLGNWEHVKFINCQAIEPSYRPDGTFSSRFDYAFGIEDCRSVSDLLFQNCYAFKAPSCGWHVENHVSTKNVVFKDCVSDSNGRMTNGYPYGYMYKGGYTFINCKGSGNYKGTFIHNALFDTGGYSFINCQEDGFKPFTYKAGIDDKKYVFDPQTGGALACTLVYVKGALGLPMKGLGPDIFGYDSTKVEETALDGTKRVKIVPYIYNKKVVFSEANRETSIASQPVRIDTNSKYEISITAKELSGTTGTMYLYVQEYDSNGLLINRGGFQHFLFKVPLVTIEPSKFNTVKFLIGKGTHILPSSGIISFDKSLAFDKGTKWIRAALVMADDALSNKSFAVNAFSVIPVNEDGVIL